MCKIKIQLSVAVPDGYEPEFDVIKIGKEAEILEVSDNPETAVQDADVVMTDTFVSIHKQVLIASKNSFQNSKSTNL